MSRSSSAPRFPAAQNATANFQLPNCKLSPPQRDLLRPPVPDLTDPQIVLGAAVDSVDHAELFRQPARLAESADDLTVQLDLVDLAVIHAFRIIRIRAVEILRRST